MDGNESKIKILTQFNRKFNNNYMPEVDDNLLNILNSILSVILK